MVVCKSTQKKQRQYVKTPTKTLAHLVYFKIKKLKMEEPEEYYVYLVDGEEKFTSNYDLASKRADEGSKIGIIRMKLY